jgi:aspartyl-tRNA(Asn)/glutamyl-tRNA(Gln) amidotransferase subunit A
MTSTPLPLLADVARDLAARTITSRALVDAALESARAQRALGVFIGDVDAADVRAQADASDARRARGEARGPLDGVPVAVKDNILVEGASCTAGSKILEGFVAPYDATAIARLKGAGAVMFGRTSCDEFGMGSTTENCAYGPCRNPRDPTRVPGGSSGGSAAAVAAGIVPLALGSDTGGSIRQPASMCGVAGIKPTWGRVSRFGLVAFASSLDVIGPLASDLYGACALLDAIAGHDARDATTSTTAMPRLVDACARGRAPGALAGKTIGVPRALLEGDSGEGLRDDVRAVLASLEQRVVASGGRVVDVELPNVKHAIAAYYVLCTAEASSNLARFDGVRYGARGATAQQSLGALYESTRALFGAEVKRRIVLGSWVLSAGYYDAYVRRAQKVRRLVAGDFERALSTCDAVWMPVSPEPAWPLGAKRDDPLAAYLADAYTVPPSLAGLPALSLNAGASREGLPVGVQLVGRAFGEEQLVELASAIEHLTTQRQT